MSPEEVTEPAKFISDFCRSWDLSDCRFYLWQMLSNSIASDSQLIGASSGSQVYFFENIVTMIEAVYLVNRMLETAADRSPGKGEEVVKEPVGIGSEGLFVYRDEESERNSSSVPASLNGIESELSLFFDSYKPEDFAVRWRTILEAYSAQDYYKQGSPSDVLYAIERLTDLIKAAQEIFRQLTGESPSYNGPEATATLGNAYSVIRQFFEMRGLDDWERCLRHVLFFALSTDDPDEGVCKEDTLWLYNVVYELVKGCWMVREVRPLSSRPLTLV
ncbi:hypothetical protein [Ravibacter arvi]